MIANDNGGMTGGGCGEVLPGEGGIRCGGAYGICMKCFDSLLGPRKWAVMSALAKRQPCIVCVADRYNTPCVECRAAAIAAATPEAPR